MKSFYICLSFLAITLFGYAQSWTTLSSLPGDAPNIPVMAAANGKIFILAGQRNSLPSPTFIYDPATDSWSDNGLAHPTGPFWASAVSCNNKIYVMGGGNPYPGQTQHYIYNPDSNTWSSATALLTGRMYHSAALADGKIYLMGGQNGDGTSEWYFDEYDPVGDLWTRKTQLPHNGSWYCGAAGIGDTVYRIAGGGYSATLIRKHFDAFSVTTNTWTEYPAFHRGLHAPATVVVKDHIFLLGGSSDYTDMDSIWVYNPKTGKWADAGFKLPAPMSYHKAVVIDDCIYVYKEGVLYKHCPDFSSVSDEDVHLCSISPNPCKEILTIRFNHTISNPISINIFNSLGQQTDNYQITFTDEQSLQINFDHILNDGLYFIHLNTDNKTYNTKVFLLR